MAREKGDGGSHGDYRDDPKLQEDERKIMDEFQQEEDDEDSA